MIMMVMKWKATTALPLIVILLISCLFQGQVAAAENAMRPPFVGKNIQETKLEIPPELQEYDSVRPISIVSNSQVLPFVLVRAWNHGTVDGTVDLWFVNHEEITLVDSIRGDARPNAASQIAYKDDGSVAFFHVGRGGLWMIDASTKEVKLVINGLGAQGYFSVINESLYFLVKSRKELWTSDWTKEGTVMAQDFENSLSLFSSVTDGFVLQVRNSSMYFWDEVDRSTTFLPNVRIDMCAPSDVAAIRGSNGSKGLIAANGLWAIGRHPPKRLADSFSWVSYVGAMENEVLLNVYSGGSSSFQLTDGERFRPMSVQLDGIDSNYGAGAGIFGPFVNNNAYHIFMGGGFLSVKNNNDDADAKRAELVATLPDPNTLGFLPLLEENKVLARSVSKLWEFDAAKNEVRLLVDWDENVYEVPEKSWRRDQTWDTFFLFPDGSVLMPMRKIAEWGQEASPIEFWSIQLNANTDEFKNYTTIVPTRSPTPGPTPNPTPATSADDGEPNTTPPTTAGKPNLDDSSSPMVHLAGARLGAMVLLVLFGSWM